LNERFRLGRPSSDLTKAGVLIHIWDHTEDERHKWQGCPAHQPGTDSTREEAGNDCLMLGNRFSSSMVWQGHAPLFGGGGGIIFRPDFTRVLCGYGADAGSRGSNDGCKGHVWCPNPETSGAWCDGLPFQPKDLGYLLESWSSHGTTYNEIIVDAAYHNRWLPYSVEAVLNDRELHRQFLQHFHGKVTEADVPLVSFNPNDASMPFKLV